MILPLRKTVRVWFLQASEVLTTDATGAFSACTWYLPTLTPTASVPRVDFMRPVCLPGEPRLIFKTKRVVPLLSGTYLLDLFPRGPASILSSFLNLHSAEYHQLQQVLVTQKTLVSLQKGLGVAPCEPTVGPQRRPTKPEESTGENC